MGFTLNQHEQEKQIKKLQKKKDQDTTNYNDLSNLPQINGVELKGDKSLSDLGIQGETLEAASGETLALVPTSEGRALLHTAYGMSTQDGTPTPSSPVDIVSAKADLRSVGKNVLPYPYATASTTLNGVTFTNNSDGSVTLDGTCSAPTAFIFWHGRNNLIPTWFMKKGLRYIISLDVLSGSIERNQQSSVLAVRDYPGNALNPYKDIVYQNSIESSVEIPFTYNSPDNYIYSLIWYECRSDVKFNNWRIRPMLRLADVTDSTYEPYKKHDTTTDLTLRAIEVTSSDAYNLVRDNKYYIADTLDYSEDNGWTVTRRIGHIASYDSESIITKWMSSKDVYASGTYPSAGAVVDYILTSETTETITTEQALALLGLKTYDESTTISSQAEPSCTVAVEYAKEKLGAVALTAYNKAVADGLNITAITPHILPDAPTTDGSYNLKVTVTSGEAAYSWEAVTP